MTEYEKPRLTSLGSLQDLTQKYNKTGTTPDAISAISDVVGSYGPVGPHR